MANTSCEKEICLPKIKQNVSSLLRFSWTWRCVDAKKFPTFRMIGIRLNNQGETIHKTYLRTKSFGVMKLWLMWLAVGYNEWWVERSVVFLAESADKDARHIWQWLYQNTEWVSEWVRRYLDWLFCFARSVFSLRCNPPRWSNLFATECINRQEKLLYPSTGSEKKLTVCGRSLDSLQTLMRCKASSRCRNVNPVAYTVGCVAFTGRRIGVLSCNQLLKAFPLLCCWKAI
jgi:hypothetical protein